MSVSILKDLADFAIMRKDYIIARIVGDYATAGVLGYLIEETQITEIWDNDVD